MTARRCPTCGGTVERAPEQALPFCSPTCKLADLGRWLDGSYRVSGPPLDVESDGHTLPGGAGTEER